MDEWMQRVLILVSLGLNFGGILGRGCRGGMAKYPSAKVISLNAIRSAISSDTFLIIQALCPSAAASNTFKNDAKSMGFYSRHVKGSLLRVGLDELFPGSPFAAMVFGQTHLMSSSKSACSPSDIIDLFKKHQDTFVLLGGRLAGKMWSSNGLEDAARLVRSESDSMHSMQLQLLANALRLVQILSCSTRIIDALVLRKSPA